MRTLILLSLFLIGCHPPSPWWDTTNSYYPPASPPDTTHRITYDSLRAERHDISLELARLIRTSATAHDIPLDIAFSLVYVESRFYPRALSHAGARGLTQVMPATGEWWCDLPPYALYFRRENLRCGFSYLSHLHRRLGSWELALASYNVGDARRVRAPLTGEPDGSWYASLVLSATTS